MGERRGTKGLELWCKKMTEGYPGVKVENMTTSWRDGLAFCAMIHHFRPELIDFSKLNKDDVYRNNELAFRVAEQYLGIPALLEPADMVEYPVPDRLSILTYLSQFYQAFAVPHGSSPSRVVPKRPATAPDRGIVSPASTSPPTKMAVRSGGVNVGLARREPCAKCGLPVFIAERLNVGKQLYHRTCFRCARCNSQLTLQNYYETETENQYCCETCPDEEKPKMVASTEITQTSNPTMLTRSLSDEEKSAGLKDQDEYSCMFETALDYSDLKNSDDSEYSKARTQFISALLGSSGEEDLPPDLPKSKPPALNVSEVISPIVNTNIQSPTSEQLKTLEPSVNNHSFSVVSNNQQKTASQAKLDKNTDVVTKENVQGNTSLVQARMRLFQPTVPLTRQSKSSNSEARCEENKKYKKELASDSSESVIVISDSSVLSDSKEYEDDNEKHGDSEVITISDDSLLQKDEVIGLSDDSLLQKDQEINTPDSLLRKNKDISGSRDSLLRKNKDVSSSRDSLPRTNKDMSSSRDSLLRTNKDMSSSRDSLLRTNKDMSTSRDSLLRKNKDISSSRDSLLWKNKDVSSSRDSLLQKNKGSSKPGDSPLQQNKDISSSRDSVVQENKVTSNTGDFRLQKNKAFSNSDDFLSQRSQVISSSDDSRLGKDDASTFQENQVGDFLSRRNKFIPKSDDSLSQRNKFIPKPDDSLLKKDQVSTNSSDSLLEDEVVENYNLSTNIQKNEVGSNSYDSFLNKDQIMTNSGDSLQEKHDVKNSNLQKDQIQGDSLLEKDEVVKNSNLSSTNQVITTFGDSLLEKCEAVSDDSSLQKDEIGTTEEDQNHAESGVVTTPNESPIQKDTKKLTEETENFAGVKRTIGSESGSEEDRKTEEKEAEETRKIGSESGVSRNPSVVQKDLQIKEQDVGNQKLGSESGVDEDSFKTVKSEIEDSRLIQSDTSNIPGFEVYPEDLNPFGDEEPPSIYEKSLNPFSDDDEDGDEAIGSKKILPDLKDYTLKGSSGDTPESLLKIKIGRYSTNPFDDDEDEMEEKEQVVKPAPRLKRLTAPRISLNPIFDDDSRDKSILEISAVNPPEPRPRTSINSGISTSTFGSSSSISSGTSSIASRKKKAAPRPPIPTFQVSPQNSVNSSPSGSVQHSPRLRKNRRAPLPPSSTPNVQRDQNLKIDYSPIPPNNSTLKITSTHNLAEALNATILSPTGSIESGEYEQEKVAKDEVNRNRQSQTSQIQSPDKILHTPSRDKSTYGKWKRKKGQAPSRPIPQKRTIKALPIAEVRRELDLIEVQQQGLEKQGVRLEQIIRERCEGPNADPEGAVSIEVEDLILQLFEVVNEKNELCRRQAELMYLQRQQRLEEEYAEVEYQIRCLMHQPDANKTDSDKEREEALIGRLVDIVERRNEIIECLEMDRVREAEEDDSICSSMNSYASKRDECSTPESVSSPKKKDKKKFKKKFKLKMSSHKMDMDKDVDESESADSSIVVKEKEKKKRKFNLF